ncbi:hypothetical protein M0R45_027165 [Rubus argutus]|uniref:Uncharacterized protein n=1 Tax=Rubus argutus TaxID=59490 RepID=A0AAW1X126_RUBAR
MSYDLFDAHLTPLGWQQVDNLRKHVQECGLAKKVDLVITSPLLRTMQTAVGVLLSYAGNIWVFIHVIREEALASIGLFFPAIDFSLIENDDDILWTPDIREKNEEVGARGLKFFELVIF